MSTAEQLFETWFRPIYPPDLRDDAALFAARATDANPARNPRLFAELDEIASIFAKLAPDALGKPDLLLDDSDASVHRLGAALTRQTRDALLARSKPGDPNALFVQLVVHGAIYVARCIVKQHGGTYGVRRPAWESVVHLESRAGVGAIAPFHWWLKALADDEIERGGLSTRYRQHVERATLRVEALEKLLDRQVDRALPTLKTVRYDLLHKYLRAHLPELNDLGRDFPTAEELQALGFLSLDFMVLGEGRMVLMHGRGKRGLHLLWLEKTGFSHALYFPATPGDPHEVKVEGDKLIVTFVADGKPQRHEMLWWG